MGRKRRKPLEPGQHTNFYIPEDIDPKILEFINAQANLSKTIIKLFHEKIYSQNTDVANIAKSTELKEPNIKKDVIENIIKNIGIILEKQVWIGNQ